MGPYNHRIDSGWNRDFTQCAGKGLFPHMRASKRLMGEPLPLQTEYLKAINKMRPALIGMTNRHLEFAYSLLITLSNHRLNQRFACGYRS